MVNDRLKLLYPHKKVMSEMLSRYLQMLIRRIWAMLFSKGPNPRETIQLLITMLLGALLSVLVAMFYLWA